MTSIDRCEGAFDDRVIVGDDLEQPAFFEKRKKHMSASALIRVSSSSHPVSQPVAQADDDI